MRNIKFRAYDGDNNAMIYSDDRKNRHKYSFKADLFGLIKPQFAAFIDGDRYTIQLDNIMQYTGLCDINEKEIYEGDILQADNGARFTVEFYDGGFIFTDGEQVENLTERAISEVEFFVVGNIYENADLLEGKQ